MASWLLRVDVDGVVALVGVVLPLLLLLVRPFSSLLMSLPMLVFVDVDGAAVA